jgi:hypothetical protein
MVSFCLFYLIFFVSIFKIEIKIELKNLPFFKLYLIRFFFILKIKKHL